MRSAVPNGMGWFKHKWGKHWAGVWQRGSASQEVIWTDDFKLPSNSMCLYTECSHEVCCSALSIPTELPAQGSTIENGTQHPEQPGLMDCSPMATSFLSPTFPSNCIQWDENSGNLVIWGSIPDQKPDSHFELQTQYKPSD